MYKRSILENGLRLISVPMAGTKTVTVLVMVRTGSSCETKSTSGISHFLEHLFFKGTKKRPDKRSITEELEGVGADYDAFTSKEYTGFYIKVPEFKIDTALDIISDVLSNSLFEEKEIEKERNVILEEIKMIKDDPPRYVADLFEMMLYGDTPAGWDIAGTPESVAGIHREQILEYFRDRYVAENIAVAVTGAISHEEVETKVKKYFAAFNGGKAQSPELVTERQDKPKVLTYNKDTDQVHLSVGVRGYDLKHPDRYVLALLGIILGGGMSSRLFVSVREKEGLGYYIFSDAEFYTYSGYLTSQAGVDVKNLEKTINIILEEYRKIAEEGATQAELKKVKDYVKGRTIMSLESSSSMASFFANQEILGTGILTPEEKFGKIDSVTVDDIKRVAKDIFQSQKLNLALIGPFGKDDEMRLAKILKL